MMEIMEQDRRLKLSCRVPKPEWVAIKTFLLEKETSFQDWCAEKIREQLAQGGVCGEDKPKSV